MSPAYHDSDKDRRLEAVLHSYLQEMDAGQAPDRDALMRRHPDLASGLAAFFVNQDEVARLANGMADPVAPATGAAEAPTLAPAETPPAAGTWLRYFGDYELLEEIARGGMGVVFKARQVSLNRPVALKMILAGQLASPQDVQRFHTEAEAAANLDHPHIVPIYEVGQHEGQHYFSMKLVEGGSLGSCLERFRSDARAAARLLATVARAVHYAHQRGILHRDLKPANILLDDQGQPHVTDFGLAKRVQGGSSVTQSGAIVGTPSYMAPEQARSEKVLTTAVDVYGLGAILYELLTGRPPFRAGTPLDTVLQVLEREPESLRKLDPHIERELETICLKCLDKDPARRYDTAAGLADDLQRWLAGELIQARPYSRLERAVKAIKRRPARTAVCLALGFMAAFIFGQTLSHNRDLTRVLNAAQNAEQAAKESEQQARDNERRANENTKLAQAEKQLNERRRYGLEMKLTGLEWDAGKSFLVQRRLNEFEPKSSGDDLRGFEWFYLRRQTQLGVRHVLDGPGTILAFSPDGARLVSRQYRDKGILTVSDTATGRKIFALSGAASPVAYSHNGRQIASAHQAANRSIKIWDATNGRELLALPLTGRLDSLAFSPDDRRLVSAEGTVKVWDLATRQVSLVLPELASDAAYSPDGRWIVSLGRHVKIWDATTGRVNRVIGDGGENRPLQPAGAAFSPNGRLFAGAARDKSVRLWDMTTGKEVGTLRGHGELVLNVAFSRDGRRLASWDANHITKIWDIERGRELLTLRGAGPGLNFSPDGRALASGDELWDILAGQEPLTFGSTSSMAFSPDGRQLICADELGKVRVRDVITGQITSTVTLSGGFDSNPSLSRFAVRTKMAFTPDARRVAMATTRLTPVKVWDTATGQAIRTIRADVGRRNEWEALAFSADGRRLASSFWPDGVIKVWDVESGRELLSLQGCAGVALNSDGRRCTSFSGGMVKVWDVDRGTVVQSCPAANKFFCPVFSPDGRRLAAGSEDDIQIWDLETGKQLLPLRGHFGGVMQLAFSRDGQRLASLDSISSVKLWDVVAGQEVLSLTPGRVDQDVGGLPPAYWSVQSLVFSPDGRRLACADRGSVRIWDATPLTDDLRVEREARSLVRLLFHKPLARDQISDAIRKDRTIDEPVRRAALAWVGPYERDVLPEEAEEYVTSLFDQLQWRTAVVKQIQADPSLGATLRQKALALAEQRTLPEDKLEMPVSLGMVDLPNVPLKDWLEFFTDRYHVDILTSPEIEYDWPVSLPILKDVSLDTVLQVTLRQVYGSYQIENNYLLVVGSDAAESKKRPMSDRQKKVEQELHERLTRPVSFEPDIPDKMSLADALELLRKQQKLNLMIATWESGFWNGTKPRAIASEFVKLPRAKGIALGVALEQLLAPLKATYEVTDNLILIVPER
jgi:WD40 repeat protein